MTNLTWPNWLHFVPSFRTGTPAWPSFPQPHGAPLLKGTTAIGKTDHITHISRKFKYYGLVFLFFSSLGIFNSAFNWIIFIVLGSIYQICIQNKTKRTRNNRSWKSCFFGNKSLCKSMALYIVHLLCVESSVATGT